MRNGVAKRALGVVLASAMVASTVGTYPGVNVQTSKVIKAAGGNALYVDDVNYYNEDYDTENAYNGKDLGCTYSKDKTVFKVWSPEADSVTLNLYKKGSPSEDEAGVEDPAFAHLEMKRLDKGVWEYEYTDGDLKDIYYTYSAIVSGQCYGEAVDPYAEAVGLNGDRGMVVDLDSTNPKNWDNDYNKKRTATLLSDIVVWEIHIRDFSIDVSSGVSEKNRGKYKAFTEHTTVNGEGKVASCVDYLKKMGVTHVQLMPTFDYEGVDEAKAGNEESKTNYNWGYNPKNYNAPDGAYSSDPTNGNTRIEEMKEMVQALHDAGIKVIMDVVYNHTGSTENSNLNKIMPDYYYKLTTNSAGDVVYNDESGCGNATRSESAMYKKFMIDSLEYWADEYHIDGFRFDLMGIHAASTMNAIREALDTKFGKDTIVLYGEGWTGGGYQKNSAYKEYCRNLKPGIGYFNDQIRDAIKGETSKEKAKQIGFAQQNFGLEDTYTDHEKFPTSVFGGIMGSVGKNTSNWWMWRAYWADTSNRVLEYDSCHDNMTIWDKFVESMGVTKDGSTATDYDTQSTDLINMSRMSAGYLLTAHGGIFLHAGEEFARTKGGNENSYNSGDFDNKLDWSRVNTYANLTDYYQGMIDIRKAFSGFRNILTETGDVVDENTETGFFNKVNGNNITEIPEFTDITPGKNDEDQIQSTVNSVGYYLSNNAQGEWNQVAVLLNNTTDSKVAKLSATDGSTQWVLVSNGKKASVTGVSTTEANEVIVPGKSVVVAVPKNTFDSVKITTDKTEIAPSTEEAIEAPKATDDANSQVVPTVTATPEVKATATPSLVQPTNPVAAATATPVVTSVANKVSTAGAVSISEFTVPTGAYQLVGKTMTVSAAAIGGNGEYQYNFYVYRGDALVKSSKWGKDTTYSFAPSKEGVYTIKVVAKDSEGRTAEQQKNILVITKVLTAGQLKATKLTVKKGKKITFKLPVTGGQKAYKYSFKVSTTAGKVVKKSGTIKKNTWSWKTTKKGKYKVQVTVKDQLGKSVTKTIKKIIVK